MFPPPATASAEGRQLNVAPSLWERVRVRGFPQWPPSTVLLWLRASATRTARYLGGIPRIDKWTNLYGIDLWTGCEPCLNGLTVFLCDATSSLASDEDVPLGVLPSTAAQQSMRFNGLA